MKGCVVNQEQRNLEKKYGRHFPSVGDAVRFHAEQKKSQPDRLAEYDNIHRSGSDVQSKCN